MRLRLILSALAVAASLFWGQAIAAPCNPSQAPPGSIGCQPPLSTPQSTDLVLGWRPSLFPNSTGVWTMSQLSAYFNAGSGFVRGPTSSTVGHLAIWANTSGTVLDDLAAGSPTTVLHGDSTFGAVNLGTDTTGDLVTSKGGTGTVTPPTAAQIPTGNSSGGQSTWRSMSGDCTNDASLVLTCASAPAFVSAAGTDQGTATVLSASYSVITNSAYQAGVVVPATTKVFHLANQSLNESLAYPPSGKHWGAYATNYALGLNPGAGMDYYCVSNQCYAN